METDISFPARGREGIVETIHFAITDGKWASVKMVKVWKWIGYERRIYLIFESRCCVSQSFAHRWKYILFNQNYLYVKICITRRKGFSLC